MTSILQSPSRGGFIRRENAAYESATVAGERMACFTNPWSAEDRINLARTIVIRYRETPSSHSLTAGILREARVTIRCASLSSGAGACADLKNLCRPLVGWSMAALQACKQPRSRLYVRFREFLRCWVLRHVDEHDRGFTRNVGTIVQERGFFSQGARRVERI